jgi:outer membrane protein, multidrug efflux system
MRNRFAAGVLALLGGCAVGPDYHRPEMAVPVKFANESAQVQGESATARFWTLFDEPLLNHLMDAALTENKDVARARANLIASRAEARLTGYDAYPTVRTSGAFARRRLSEHEQPGTTRPDRGDDDVDAGFDAVWELDFFGGVRRDIEAARAEAQAAQAQLHDVQVTVTAEVARNYFVLRGLQDQLEVATRNAVNQRITLDLTQTRLEAGRGTELDTARAETQLGTTLASIPPLRTRIATTAYRLSVLTGRLPDALTAELMKPTPLPKLPQLDAIGSPEDLLRRRPDIRVAERSLAASTARVGVAVADLFPKVTFFGRAGYVASSIGKLGSSGSESYAFGPQISWAAFDLGRVRARIAVANAQTDAALAAYQATVLVALEETEDALTAFGGAQDRSDILSRASAASEKAARLARQRFEGGLTDFLDVLDAEREALSAQDSLAQSRTDTATAMVAIYKALGGGWEN